MKASFWKTFQSIHVLNHIFKQTFERQTQRFLWVGVNLFRWATQIRHMGSTTWGDIQDWDFLVVWFKLRSNCFRTRACISGSRHVQPSHKTFSAAFRALAKIQEDQVCYINPSVVWGVLCLTTAFDRSPCVTWLTNILQDLDLRQRQVSPIMLLFNLKIGGQAEFNTWNNHIIYKMLVYVNMPFYQLKAEITRI